MLKSLLGNAIQWSREKFAIVSLKPRSHVRILLHHSPVPLKMMTFNTGLSQILSKVFMSIRTCRLRVVPYFSSGIVERLFSRGVIFTRARVSLALLSLRKNGGLLEV